MQTQKIVTQYSAAICFALWIFTPLLRRFMEWHSAYQNVSLYSLIPLAALLPALVWGPRSLRQFGPLFGFVLTCVQICYFYGLFISVLNANVVPGIYDFCMALSPLGLLIYIRWIDDDFIVAYDTFCRQMFWISCVAALYGMYQFVAAPAWDINWLTNTGVSSFGLPEPFALRIFGPTSSPMFFAELLAFVLVMNTGRYGLKHWPYVLGTLPMFAALILSTVRTAWIECAVGFFVCIILSPIRHKILTSLAVSALAFSMITGYLAGNLEGFDTSLTSVSMRLQSFGDLSDDFSYQDRQNLLKSALQDSLSNPIGQGLGVIGLAAKLSDQATTVDFDNGYLGRFYETGLLGMASYMLGILYVLWQSIALYLQPLQNAVRKQHGAVAVALQGMLLFGMTSVDVYFHAIGIFFWMIVALMSIYKLQAAQQPSSMARKRLEAHAWFPLIHVQ